MTLSLVGAAYIVAGLLFIASLAGLARHETARAGSRAGIVGMTIALLATIAEAVTTSAIDPLVTLLLILLAMGLGAAIGIWRAVTVEMTQMPELVALLHSFVGAAAVLVGFNAYFAGPSGPAQLVEIYAGSAIGAVTLTGSLVAFGKLSGRVKSAPILLPARHWLNLAAVVSCVGFGVWFAGTGLVGPLVFGTAIALAVGAHLVASIGGGDMPVVVSMLNSYSGWAAAAAGFMLGNDLLIITGALVGSSGAILSYLMCKAMNRSFVSVIAGGFGDVAINPATANALEQTSGQPHEIDVDGVAALLTDARSVVIAPGYGMAVAKAQHPVAELTDLLRRRGTEVRFAIHPVAGRLPGHMNVLLAEAKVPYDIVEELDEINDDWPEVDVVLVIGANDTVNPAALDQPGSPIAGMPVLHVWRARDVVVFKRSMAAGYAGVQNPLFFNSNTQMLFGDAKQRVQEIVARLR